MGFKWGFFIGWLIIDKMVDEEGLKRCIVSYFKKPNIEQETLLRLMEFLNEFAAAQRKRDMVDRIFQTMQSTCTKENIKIVYKRYLFLINEMLNRDVNFPYHLRYCDVLSQVLPSHFVFILKGALANATDILILIKYYRKRWAKRITDSAYHNMRNEALNTLKFDLDKGFPEDQIKKIHKDYRKRNFTGEQINKYMPSNKPRHEELVRSEPSSSSSEEGRRNPHNDSMIPHSSFNPSLMDPRVADPRHSYPNPYQGYPPQPPYIPYPNPSISYQQPQPMFYHSNHLAVQPAYQQAPMPYNMPPMAQPLMHYPPVPNQYQNGYDRKPTRKGTELYEKMHDLLSKLRMAKGFICKFCGLQLSTLERHEGHMQLHFTESQKQYEVAHSRRDHARKNVMPTIQQWLGYRKSKTQEAIRLFVAIKGGSLDNKVSCVICKGELKVNWCGEMDSWVFQDSMRVNLGKSREQICHEVCYSALNQLENSD